MDMVDIVVRKFSGLPWSPQHAFLGSFKPYSRGNAHCPWFEHLLNFGSIRRNRIDNLTIRLASYAILLSRIVAPTF
jgi:hypothetical protein